MKRHLIWTKNGYEIAAARNAMGNPCLTVSGPSMLSDWPILYDDGRIGYDYPESWPKYVKSAVKKILTGKPGGKWVTLADAAKIPGLV